MISVGDTFHVLILPGILHLKDHGGQTWTSQHLQEKERRGLQGVTDTDVMGCPCLGQEAAQVRDPCL